MAFPSTLAITNKFLYSSQEGSVLAFMPASLINSCVLKSEIFLAFSGIKEVAIPHGLVDIAPRPT
jgi:hypothetical protein